MFTNASDVLARYVGLILNVPTRVRGNVVKYEDAVLDTAIEKASYRLSYNNSNSAPLFPRGTLSRLF